MTCIRTVNTIRGNGHFEHLQAPEKFKRVPIRVTVVVYAYALFSNCYATIWRCDLLFDIGMGKHRKKHKSERERYVLVLIVSDDHHEVTGRTLPPRLEGVSLSGRRTTRFVLSWTFLFSFSLIGPIYMSHLSRISFVAKQLSLGFLRLKCGVEIHAAFQVFCAACELHVREIWACIRFMNILVYCVKVIVFSTEIRHTVCFWRAILRICRYMPSTNGFVKV